MQAHVSPRPPTLAHAFGAAAMVGYGQVKYGIRRLLRSSPSAALDSVQALLELHSEGYFVVPGYYSAEQCERLREEIDRIIREQPDVLQKDKHQADCRIFGAERASMAILDFHHDDFCRRTGEYYRRGALINFSTLAARLSAIPGNLGSGQGWHRDAFHFQYKAMIYLSDVGMENGPFQLLPRSHHTWQVIRDTVAGRLDRPPASRITEAQIQKLLARDAGRARALAAPAGTLILFNSSAIHRGMPIRSGVRYALTNYYYPPKAVTPDMYQHFAPFART